MDKMDGLRAGVAEMRSVALRLNQWANDLEQTVSDDFQVVRSSETSELPGGGVLMRAVRENRDHGSAVRVRYKRRLSLRDDDLEASLHDQASPKEEAGSGKAFTLPEVRTVLAGKCAAGFGTQVKGLIESYGASTLKDVPAEKYEELLEAVRGLGDADAG